MRKVPLQEVEDGMVLATPLTGSSGNVLMGKGIVLKSSIVPRLSAWGVTHVCIEGDPLPGDILMQPGDLKAQASLEKMFAGKTASRPMDIIFHCLLRYRSRNVNG